MRSGRYDTRMDPEQGSLRRTAMLAAASLVLFANFWTGVALSVQSPAANDAGRFWASDPRVLCTSPAPERTASNGAETPAQPQPAGDTSHPSCLFCLPLLQGSLSPAEADGVTAPRAISAVAPWPHEPSTADAGGNVGSHSPRGPPGI